VFSLLTKGALIFFAKVRDSSTLDSNKVSEYRKKVIESIPKGDGTSSAMFDSFAFHKSSGFRKLQSDSVALELTKKMLRLENKYRLSKEYLSKYAESQKDGWKTFVTEEIQQRVVTENFEEGRQYFNDIPSGIDFLRGSVGNFPNHLPELMECANYVKYTQECKRGHLRVGDTLLSSHVLPDIPEGPSYIPLINPKSQKREYLKDFFTDKPLVIIASSST